MVKKTELKEKKNIIKCEKCKIVLNYFWDLNFFFLLILVWNTRFRDMYILVIETWSVKGGLTGPNLLQ